MSEDLQKKSINNVKIIVIVMFVFFSFFMIENLVVFYFKYNSAIASNGYDIRKKTEYLTYQFVNYFKNASNLNVANFQNYINNSAIGNVILLKDNDKNGFKIVAASDASLVGKDYDDKECGDIYSHDFQKDYFLAEILPENSAKVCMFVPIKDYILGFKANIDQRIVGFSDRYFYQWFFQNMYRTFFISFAGLIVGLIVSSLFIIKYKRIVSDYDKLKKDSVEKIADLSEKLYIDPMTGLLNKVKADILLCGPCFNYYNYAEMSSILAEHVKKETSCKPVVVCSEENKEIIDKYKNDLVMIKMPKKGGVGLRESLQNMADVIKCLYEGSDLSEVSDYIYK